MTDQEPEDTDTEYQQLLPELFTIGGFNREKGIHYDGRLLRPQEDGSVIPSVLSHDVSQEKRDEGGKWTADTSKMDPEEKSDHFINHPSVISKLKIPKVMYHIAPARHAQSIIENGIKTDQKRTSKDGRIRGVYLAPSPQSDIGGDVKTSDTVVFAVDTTKLNLRLDPEFFHYAMTASIETARKYIDEINEYPSDGWGMYSQANIPPDAIQLIENKQLSHDVSGEKRDESGRWTGGGHSSTRKKFRESVEKLGGATAQHIKTAKKRLQGVTKKFFSKVEARYGRKTAIAVLVAGQAVGWGTTVAGAAVGIPVWLPGASLWGGLPIVAVAEVLHQLKQAVGPDLATGDEVDKELVERFAKKLQKRLQRALEAYIKDNEKELSKEDNTSLVNDISEPIVPPIASVASRQMSNVHEP